MKVFKGVADSWGIEVTYRNWDKSLTFQLMQFYIVFVAHKWWKH